MKSERDENRIILELIPVIGLFPIFKRGVELHHPNNMELSTKEYLTEYAKLIGYTLWQGASVLGVDFYLNS